MGKLTVKNDLCILYAEGAWLGYMYLVSEWTGLFPFVRNMVGVGRQDTKWRRLAKKMEITLQRVKELVCYATCKTYGL